jgi:predicted nucleic acid-binding protein
MILTLDSKRRPRRREYPKISEAPQAVNWLLDSNVLSQPAKRTGDPRVIAWLEDHQDQCYTSSIAQLALWVRSKRGKQLAALQAWLTDLIEAMHGRILGFNVSVAHVWAERQHQLQTAGRRQGLIRLVLSEPASVFKARSIQLSPGWNRFPHSIP